MASDTITNFILPTNTVMAWVKTKLEGYGDWDVSQFDQVEQSQVFKYIEGLRPPFAFSIYTGSRYQPENVSQRRLGTFAVVVGAKSLSNQNTAGTSCHNLLDKAISLLDHEINGDLFCVVVGDKVLAYENSGIVALEVNFEFRDH